MTPENTFHLYVDFDFQLSSVGVKRQLVHQLTMLPIFLLLSLSSHQFKSKSYLIILLKHALPSSRSWFNFLYRPLISSCGWLWLQNKLRWSLSYVFWKTSGLVEQSCYWLNFICFINLQSLRGKRKVHIDYLFLGLTDFSEAPVPYLASCLKGFFFLHLIYVYAIANNPRSIIYR